MRQSTGRLLGYGVLAFGAGILLSFFLPDKVLVIIEAAVIIFLGALCAFDRV